MVTPKTIVITSLPAKTMMMTTRPLATMAQALPLDVYDGLGIYGEPKKRKRLTNLSPDERMMRRKLKNRVAAQTARDRKKQRMDEVEILLAEIEAENKRLQSENDALRKKTGKLAVENSQLKKKLSVGEVLVHESPESAVLYPPPQQELIHAASHKPTLPFLQMFITASLMCCLGSWNKSPAASSKKMQALHRQAPVRRLQHTLVHRPPPFLTWWGPQQQNWTPSMN